MTALANFHLLRPLWLMALVPAGWLVWQLYRRDGAVAWRRVIAPHLLEPLLTTQDDVNSRLRPLHLLGLFWLTGALALAGPAWEREPAPFADDRAALVIALHLGPTMLARDVAPSRLERSVHKIRDLLALRPGARVALLAYAGSAHEVIPFTTDAELVADFAAELAPELMPLAGNDPGAAVALADDLLTRAKLSGSILLITDSMPGSGYDDRDSPVPVDLLAMAAPPGSGVAPSGPPAPALDERAMAAAARTFGGRLERVTVDDADVRSLARRFDLRPSAPAEGMTQRWRDAGYYLVFPLAGVLLLWFRRGWAVRWDG